MLLQKNLMISMLYNFLKKTPSGEMKLEEAKEQ